MSEQEGGGRLRRRVEPRIVAKTVRPLDGNAHPRFPAVSGRARREIAARASGRLRADNAVNCLQPI